MPFWMICTQPLKLIFWIAQSIVDEWKQEDNSIQNVDSNSETHAQNFTISDRWSTMSTVNRDTLP